MKNIFSKRAFTRAETILEVVIAISVIMIILAPASALYIASVRTEATNRNDLTAAALAEEGIEIVRNIRDTNFIKFSNKARDCWNTKPGAVPPGTDCADTANKIAAGSYRLSVHVAHDDDYMKWTFSDPAAIGGADALNRNLTGASDGNYRLSLDALDVVARPECTNAPGEAAAPPDCHVHFRDDTHVYYHAEGAGGVEVESPFYREVTIEYVNLWDPPGTGPPDGDDAMKVFSRVLYRTGTAVRAIERVAFLTREPS